MKIGAVILLAAALCGCALSPADLQERGIRHEFAMREAPAGAAACVARNVENSDTWSGVHVDTAVREGAAPGQAELVVSRDARFFMTANFAPAQNGAAAEVRTSPQIADSLRDRLLSAFRGC